MGSRRALLVLGGSGFLGVHLVEAALGTGGPWERVVFASRSPETAPLSAEAAAAARGEALDLVADEALEGLLERIDPGWVISAAAMARAADCERDPEAALRTNRDLPRRLGVWAAPREVRVLAISTDLVFGARPAPAGGFREEDAPGPLSRYGESKLAGEEELLRVWPRALIARLPLLYGDSRGRGAGATDQVLAAWARGETPTLFTDEWRTPVEVRDAAEALLSLVPGEAGGRVHLGGPERITRAELGRRLASRIGALGRPSGALREAPRKHAPGEAPRAADTSLADGRARQLLGRSLLGVEAGLARCLA